jgi:alkylation response protein AidB-like acyl-CoA dehydrogenase
LLGPFGPVNDAERGEQAGRWVRGFFMSLANTIAGGSAEIQRNIIAERILGLPREVRG